jgi:EAL and modified HD-GYP domain-containing signal transduction protein
MPELLSQLPIGTDVQRALLQHEGEIGRILHSVLAYESGDWDDIHQLEIDSSVITDSYLRALVWAEAS